MTHEGKQVYYAGHSTEYWLVVEGAKIVCFNDGVSGVRRSTHKSSVSRSRLWPVCEASAYGSDKEHMASSEHAISGCGMRGKGKYQKRMPVQDLLMPAVALAWERKHILKTHDFSTWTSPSPRLTTRSNTLVRPLNTSLCPFLQMHKNSVFSRCVIVLQRLH